MDPIDKLHDAIEYVGDIRLEGPGVDDGRSIAAGYEAIRTWSLAAIAHELHHVRHDVAGLREHIENDGVTMFLRPERLVDALMQACGLMADNAAVNGPGLFAQSRAAAGEVRAAAALPPWLVEHNDGTISVDTEDATPAEADRRVITAQLYRAGWRPLGG